MPIFILTLAAFAIAMSIMAVGVVLSGKTLRGSCGGPNACDCVGGRIGRCPRNQNEDSTEV